MLLLPQLEIKKSMKFYRHKARDESKSALNEVNVCLF